MAKAIKTICLEILMYLTIVTMSGHVIAHFFDYYVTRNELSQMKIALNTLKIALNSMGRGYNRLNDDFSEIIGEGSSIIPESKQKYNYKVKGHNIQGINKEFESILNNIKQKDSLIIEENNFKDKSTLSDISPIGRTYLKEKQAQKGTSYSKRDSNIISRDRTTSGGFTPVEKNQVKDSKISLNINNSRRSEFCEVIGKPNLRCFCKKPPSYNECYDDEKKNVYLELL